MTCSLNKILTDNANSVDEVSHDVLPSVMTLHQQSKRILPWLKLFVKRDYFREEIDFPDFFGILGKMNHVQVYIQQESSKKYSI